MTKPVTLAVIGAGARGYGYAKFAKSFPDRLKIVAVADPNDFCRNRMAGEHNIPAGKCFRTWQEFCAQPKMCDAVAICTQDSMHEAPAVACAKLKYNILLEKPMAPTAEACRKNHPPRFNHSSSHHNAHCARFRYSLRRTLRHRQS